MQWAWLKFPGRTARIRVPILHYRKFRDRFSPLLGLILTQFCSARVGACLDDHTWKGRVRCHETLF